MVTPDWMELGSVAEWVAAVGTILAFAAVALQLRAEQRARLETENRQLIEKYFKALRPFFIIDEANPSAGCKSNLGIENNSGDLVFRDVEIELYSHPDGSQVARGEAVERLHWDYLTPEETVLTSIEAPWYETPKWAMVVRFTDPADVRWERNTFGAVRRVR
jgi:hypothetical protein